MEAVFFKLLNMSIQASILIAVVALLRVVLRKSPKWIHCLLWGLVALRLVCPFSLESNVSMAPADTVIDMDNFIVSPDVHAGDNVNTDPKAVLPQDSKNRNADFKGAGPESINPAKVLAAGWIAGLIVMLGYAFISSFRVYRRIRLSIRIRDNIYACDNIGSPFIFGIIRPRIYVPSSITDEQLGSVAAHEKAHIKRYDYMWKPFGYVILSVYWFNPLCWFAYIMLCRDIELACDEKVIKDMDTEQRKVYSRVLLSFSEPKKHISVCPLAFGEIGVRERIRSVMNYKKPSFWIIAAAIAAVVISSALFMTSPKAGSDGKNGQNGNTTDNAADGAGRDMVSGQQEPREQTQTEEDGHKDIQGEKVEVSVPALDMTDTTGADGSSIYYADKDKFIFGGCYGLFVYDMAKKRVIRSVDLKPVGCNYTQGDNACEVNVTKNGMTVLLHPIGTKEMYEYNVAKNTMYLKDYNLDGYELYENRQSTDEFGTKLASYEEDGKVKDIILVNDYTIGELGYSDDLSRSSYQSVFNDLSDENMGIVYEGSEGHYVVDGDMVFRYKKVLTGRSPNAACDSKYIVLTNNKNITFEKVDKSFFSSSMDDMLDDTVVIGIKTLE